jgi:ribosome-associated protein
MDIRQKQRVVVEALEDIKGKDIQVYNTASMPSMFERVVIASGDSNRQVKALAQSVQEKIKQNGAKVYGVEGERSGEWVLVDLGDVVVHVMHPTVREFYDLEEVWGGKPVRMKKAPAPAAARGAAKGAVKGVVKGAVKRAAKKPAKKKKPARAKAARPRRKR